MNVSLAYNINNELVHPTVISHLHVFLNKLYLIYIVFWNNFDKFSTYQKPGRLAYFPEVTSPPWKNEQGHILILTSV